jgi:Mg/Co/Ni transporter MgtE
MSASALFLAGGASRTCKVSESNQALAVRLLSKYDLLDAPVPVVAEGGLVLGIVAVDEGIDAIIAESTEDVPDQVQSALCQRSPVL